MWDGIGVLVKVDRAEDMRGNPLKEQWAGQSGLLG